MKDDKINMLLDIENFYGQHESRLTPLIKFLAISGAPVILWVYFGFFIPLIVFLPILCVWSVRVGLITIGREHERLTQFRKIIADEYASAADMCRIKTVHPDGCIEYVDGTVCYLVIAENGTTYDATARAQKIADFMSMLGSEVDVYVQNVTEMKSLDKRYSNIQLFADEDAARDFIDIIDHNRSIVYMHSLLTRIVFAVRGRTNNWTEVRDNCKMAVLSESAKAFKSVQVCTPILVQEALDTDIRGVIDLDSLLQKKYATHQYYGSKLLYYDNKPKSANVGIKEEMGFMIEDD